MNLNELGVTTAKIKQFQSKDIETAEDLARFFPRKYYDFRKETGLLSSDEFSCITMYVDDVKLYDSKTSLIIVSGRKIPENTKIKVMWFRKQFMFNKLYMLKGMNVYVCGKATYDATYNNYTFSEPIVFSSHIKASQRIYPIYSKINGMSEDYLQDKLRTAIMMIDYDNENFVPDWVIRKFGLYSLKEAIAQIHNPTDFDMLEKAKERIDFEDLLYFALRLETEKRLLPTGTPFVIKTMKKYYQFIESLPYSLTADQEKVLKHFIEKAKDCRRISSLVCGDVGSGKTVVMQALATLFAENGYQVGVLCPSVALANQHLKDTKELLEPLGLTVELYRGSSMKAKEKREMLARVASGETDILIGTHAILSDDVKFQNLALACVDEEQKFSVLQRKALTDKAQTAAVNVVTFSATPIPLTLFKALSSISLDVQTIKTKPANRIPPKSAITSKQSEIFRVIEREIRAGRQAYVITPMIDATERSNGESVEELSKLYKDYFEPLGFSVGTLTGRDSREYMADVFEKFGNNEIQILVASTIIETGINFKNANCLALYGGKYLGLSQAHQIRGRILRGGYIPYFMVYSQDHNNERLKKLISTDDGFEISEFDLQMRSQGQLVDGYAQHGSDKYVDLMMENLALFNEIREVSSDLIDKGEAEDFLNNRTK